MSTYVGYHDNDGYQVYVNGSVLPLNEIHTATRDWTTVEGVKQIALDIIIFEFTLQYHEPPPTPDELRLHEHAVAAWLPHIAYAHELQDLLVPGHATSRWIVEGFQLRQWLARWMLDMHSQRVLANPPSFDEWCDVIARRLGADWIMDTGIPLAYQIRAYVSGMPTANILASYRRNPVL